ncbi:hypothetical protein M406DRAFT_75538 [Cryphonectria parasitica EP155]|uniref:Uncharacterized protein n=1 Tax=Cryphonectria parasitica (strain ATCC 38755 / EP155) TaxID=660469 RepID=A0A9P4Y868_CRYP1|nr:uncharacterized protein M406DRAFT_75538 [Cryphonectria parasitica EP155]KAF3768194.1 hypothetical protein M406DRAFT_75538 [Cryphonectria parasitica EP155]
MSSSILMTGQPCALSSPIPYFNRQPPAWIQQLTESRPPSSETSSIETSSSETSSSETSFETIIEDDKEAFDVELPAPSSVSFLEWLNYPPIWTVERMAKMPDGKLSWELELRPVACPFREAIDMDFDGLLNFCFSCKEEYVRKVPDILRPPLYNIRRIPGKRTHRFLEKVYWGKECMIIVEFRTWAYTPTPSPKAFRYPRVLKTIPKCLSKTNLKTPHFNNKFEKYCNLNYINRVQAIREPI